MDERRQISSIPGERLKTLEHKRSTLLCRSGCSSSLCVCMCTQLPSKTVSCCQALLRAFCVCPFLSALGVTSRSLLESIMFLVRSQNCSSSACRHIIAHPSALACAAEVVSKSGSNVPCSSGSNELDVWPLLLSVILVWWCCRKKEKGQRQVKDVRVAPEAPRQSHFKAKWVT
jgi:hypothetical protein